MRISISHDMPYSLNTSTPRAFSKSGICSVSSFSACSFVISLASSSITTVTLSAPFAHHHRSITVFCQAVSYGNYLHVGENACTRQMRLGFFSNRERFVLYYPPCLRRASLVQFALPFRHVFAIRLYRPLSVAFLFESPFTASHTCLLNAPESFLSYV